MKIYCNIDDRSLTTPKNIPLEILVIFFNTDVTWSTQSWRRWLSAERKSTGGNLSLLKKENDKIKLWLDDWFDNLHQYLIIKNSNFVELLDTWDELVIEKKIRELVFVEKDGYYTIRPYDKEQDQDILLSDQ